MRKREGESAGFFLLKDGTKSQYVCSVESNEAADIKNILNYGNDEFQHPLPRAQQSSK